MAAATTGLNVIALISGGKDSLFCLLHCLENGHRVIALANLYPAAPAAAGDNGKSSKLGNSESTDVVGGGNEAETETVELDDLNSFMYQTVGHSLIPLYAECLGLPLYRRAITGSATQTGRYYDSSTAAATITSSSSGGESSDETEDLIPLLQRIKAAHPEANALCSGAILSTYQRTRVESVAVRLGLIPLAYLWQYPALPHPASRPDSLTGLLDDMAATGCDARLVKIASGGIPQTLLGADVGDARTRKLLVAGLAPFFEGAAQEGWLRGAVLGEGGEYETLAVGGPRRLWRKRMVLDEGGVGALTREGGVHYAVLRGVRVVEQGQEGGEGPGGGHDAMPLPGLLDEQFQAVLSKVNLWEEGRLHDDSSALPPSTPTRTSAHGQSNSKNNTPLESLRLTQISTGSSVFIANLTVQDTSAATAQGTLPLSATEQMQHIVSHLQEMLKSISASSPFSGDPQMTPSSSSIISTTLLLRNMADFSAINAVYATLFWAGEPNPPARVTFSCSELPLGIEVSLSVILSLTPRHSRRALHVQSRSYWAPANIGPYSQAICEPLALLDRSTTTGEGMSVDVNMNVHDAGLVEIVHVAGQIPLVPQSMEIVREKASGESAVLSLQHLWRVGQERGVDVWSWGIALLKGEEGLGTEARGKRAQLAWEVWKLAHLVGARPESSGASDDESDNDDEAEGPDAWDLRFNRSTAFQSSHLQVTVGAHLHILPNSEIFSDGSTTKYIPSFIAAVVTALPRDAPVEWWSLGIANLSKDRTSKPRVEVRTGSFPWGFISIVTIQPTTSAEEGSPQGVHLVTNLVTVLVRPSMDRETAADARNADIENELSEMLLSGNHTYPDVQFQFQSIHGTAFIASEVERCWKPVASKSLLAAVTTVPCTSLFGSPAISIRKQSSEISSAIENASPPSQQGGALESTGPAVCQPLELAIALRIERRVAI